MEKIHTQRGFSLYEFFDSNGVKCSIQKSSVATYDAIWIGCNEANPRALNYGGDGWQPVELPPVTVCDTRMHLTIEQAEELIPILQQFVTTGEI